jgi:8-oxo-dGTP pyrophosphatase MutT (NUDIX family)
MSKNPFKTLSTKIVYQNPWMRIREDAIIRPDGTEGIYGVMESRNSVAITALNEKNEVYIIRSFKYPVSEWSWGLPGGGGEDEDALIASKRELAEETGITANEWNVLGETRVSSGLMTERMAVLLARDLTFGEKIDADDSDLISEGKFVSFDTIDEMIKDHQIDDAQTVTGLYLALRWLHRNE